MGIRKRLTIEGYHSIWVTKKLAMELRKSRLRQSLLSYQAYIPTKALNPTFEFRKINIFLKKLILKLDFFFFFAMNSSTKILD